MKRETLRRAVCCGREQEGQGLLRAGVRRAGGPGTPKGARKNRQAGASVAMPEELGRGGRRVAMPEELGRGGIESLW
jgi:hypothetical protein